MASIVDFRVNGGLGGKWEGLEGGVLKLHARGKTGEIKEQGNKGNKETGNKRTGNKGTGK